MQAVLKTHDRQAKKI